MRMYKKIDFDKFAKNLRAGKLRFIKLEFVS